MNSLTFFLSKRGSNILHDLYTLTIKYTQCTVKINGSFSVNTSLHLQFINRLSTIHVVRTRTF